MSTWYKEDGSTYNIQVDYVAGLVAKATIEAAEYYQNFDWSKPWFKSVEWYGNKCTVPTEPNNLDAINASKMYFGIYNLANGAFKNDAGTTDDEQKTDAYAQTQLGKALTALKNYNKEYKSDGTGGYAFPANTTVTLGDNSISLDGGWFHKNSYLNEMWLDGQYMGPATLAQLIKGYPSYTAISDNDWKLITKQFSIVWNMCWDDTEELLYHAFCSEPRSNTWADEADIWKTAQTNKSSWKGMSAAGHSAAFWGRAEGWYFLALVDVLEQMQIAGLDSESDPNHSCYTTLKGYLDKLALGIAKRQDATSGCWYQLIGKDGNYSAQYYNGDDKGVTKNYLESSCTAIFTAAYLKAIRLGLLEKDTYFSTAEKAYKGMVKQFMKKRTDGTVDLLGCCKSAGVGTAALGNQKFRDGSNAYYLHGYDVTPTSTNSGDYYTEGKVLGAFILAATEYEREYQPSMLLSKDLNETYNLSSNESLTVEVLGDGTATYQWYNANTSTAIEGATNASYTPTKSGKYYCKITVTPTSAGAKTIAASTSDPYTFTTSIAEVTVESTGTETGGETGGSVTNEVIYFETKDDNTSTKPSVVDASGAQTTTGSVTYNGDEYTNGVKLNSSGIVKLNLTSSSTVTLVFKSSNKGNTVYIGSSSHTIGDDGTLPVELEAGKYEIKKNSGESHLYAVDIQPTGPSMSISTQPESADYVTGATVVTPLSVGVTFNNAAADDYDLSYQWYRNTVNSTTGGDEYSKEATCTPDVNTAGTTYYYYCVVKATLKTDVSKTLTATSNVATITVKDKTYTVTYNMNGNGTQIDPASDLTALPNPLPTPSAVEGYTFGGWYTDEALTQEATAGATISDDITLYAKWTKNKYTVTATAEHGSIAITDGNSTIIESGSQVEHGKSLTFTATADAGYEFSSWSVTGTTGTENSNVYTIESLTQATTVTANFTATSSGGGETGGSGTGTVIYFPSGKTSSNEDVLTVSSGNAKSGLNVSYGGKTYTNGIKMESSTTIYLNLDVKSEVTFVFDVANKQFKVSGTTYTTGQDGTCTITLEAGQHTISKVDTSVNLVAVEVKSSGSSISFTTHPQDAEYVTGATATALTVEAQVNNVTGDAPTIKYQWYKNTTTKSTDGGTPIEGKTNKSYTPDVLTAGTTYYYCKASATVEGEDLEAYSNIATVTVSDPTLTIVTQPVGATYARGQSGVEPLMVVAETNTGSAITYQWYYNSSESTEGATEIQNEKSDSYTPPVTEVGKKYYYCVVTSGDLTKNTDIVTITVNNDQPIYGYKVSKAGLTAPGINTSMYINTKTDGTGENLVKMTFGGWKWSNGKYVKPNSETEITDSWKDSETQSGVTVLDGYNYWFLGTQDAVQEDKTAKLDMYGQTRYGWFVSPTRDESGKTTESHPYTLPVRGSFMTFEPTQNGTLTIYILQNGAWNTFDKDTKLDGVSYVKGDIKPGEFRMHAFQVTNQRGLVLEEFSPKYSVTNNQKVETGYSCSKYLETDKPTSFEKTSKDVSNWEEFWALTEAERKAVYDNWSVESNGGCQEIIKLKNGSFLAIQKAVVKYQFHVTGNETYYFFSNFSKMGFSGATFQPDAAQPTATPAEGKISTLDLSDVKAYNKITAKENGKIEGTDLKNYDYSINDKDIAPVAGVSIPQFYSITLTRTFKPNQWTTLTLPFNLTEEEVQRIFGAGTQLIQLNNATVNNGCAKLEFIYHEIQNVLPGHPYLIKPTGVEVDETNDATADVDKDEYGNITAFTVYSKCVNPFISQVDIDCGAYTFKGVPGYSTPNEKSTWSVDFKENDIFVSDGDGKMYVSAGSSHGKGYRAWFKKKEDTTSGGKINSISLVIDNPGDDDDNVVTTIDMVDVDPDVFNALGIATGVYNLNGQKVSDDMRSLPKGIYIVNGKKIVRK